MGDRRLRQLQEFLGYNRIVEDGDTPLRDSGYTRKIIPHAARNRGYHVRARVKPWNRAVRETYQAVF
jgi:hypothetical protein